MNSSGYITRRVLSYPQNGFIRTGVSSICNRVGFSMDRMSTEELVDVTLVEQHGCGFSSGGLEVRWHLRWRVGQRRLVELD